MSVIAARDILLKCLLQIFQWLFILLREKPKEFAIAYGALRDWGLINFPLLTPQCHSSAPVRPQRPCCSIYIYMLGCFQRRSFALAVLHSVTLSLKDLMTPSLAPFKSVQMSFLWRDLHWPLYLKLQQSSELPQNCLLFYFSPRHIPPSNLLIYYAYYLSPHTRI